MSDIGAYPKEGLRAKKYLKIKCIKSQTLVCLLLGLNPVISCTCLAFVALSFRGNIRKDDTRIARPKCKFIFEVRNWSKTLELTIDHDGKSVTESLTFLHRVTGQDDTLTCSLDPLDYLPEVSSCYRIHSCAGFIKEYDWRLSNQWHGHIQLPFITSTVGSWSSVNVFLNSQKVCPPDLKASIQFSIFKS